MGTYSYDQLPYPKKSHPTAHIRRLEAAATLFGMPAPPITNCRVLELGCASGWNLIPQAMEFPDSEFVGVELSGRQVAEGQRMVAESSLENIQLRQANILEIDSRWGKFDYIVCHGVFSWVPEDVRLKILEVCQDNLSPQGVALVSYNVLPGWHFRGMIRDLMLYHTAQFDEPEARVDQARAVLEFMADNCAKETGYGQMLHEELDIVRSADGQYLFHDHLEHDNTAFYFHQFIEQVEVNGLQYLADANTRFMFPNFHSEQAKQALQNAPLVKQEQYLDFLRNNTFRSSLLCHRDISLERTIDHETISKFLFCFATRPEPFAVSFKPSEPLTVRIGEGTITSDVPLVMALLEHMDRTWPRHVSLEEMFQAAIRRLDDLSAGEAQSELSVRHVITDTIMNIFAEGLLEFSLHPPLIANTVSHRPLASPLARLQALSSATVTNQRHENIKLDDFSRNIVPLLDSQHDRAMLVENIEALVQNGALSVSNGQQQIQSIEQNKLHDLINAALDGICKASLLTA